MKEKNQVGGNHYQRHAIQPITFITENNLEYCQGSIIKYIARHQDKGGKEDLMKAKWFIDKILMQQYKSNPNGEELATGVR